MGGWEETYRASQADEEIRPLAKRSPNGSDGVVELVGAGEPMGRERWVGGWVGGWVGL